MQFIILASETKTSPVIFVKHYYFLSKSVEENNTNSNARDTNNTLRHYALASTLITSHRESTATIIVKKCLKLQKFTSGLVSVFLFPLSIQPCDILRKWEWERLICLKFQSAANQRRHENHLRAVIFISGSTLQENEKWKKHRNMRTHTKAPNSFGTAARKVS